jgi:Spy/CpxP family protein refolding chaperone
MKKSAFLLALALGVSAWCSVAQEQGDPPPVGGPPAGGPGGQRGFHLLPPRAVEQLNLTANQQKQLADLEADVKAKIEKILTPDQLKQLREMRPPPPRGGMGGDGPGGGPGGPGAEGEPPPPPQEQ